VPAEYILRARRIGVDTFGRENVMANFAPPEEVERMAVVGEDDDLLGEYTRKHAPRLVGRAGRELARYLPDRSIDDLRPDRLWHGDPPGDGSCRSEFEPDEMWEIHVDPYGNIQTCCGIILGNAHQIPLADRMKNGFTDGEVAKAVHKDGPFELLRMAVELGYEPREGYPQKCNLCWEVRCYLRPYFPDELGPDEIYGKL
jgi:hypothetical protein